MPRPAIEITGVGLIGDGVKPATLELSKGLNLLYGGSNAGKSYILQVIDFMLGAKDGLPLLDQGRDYERALLGLRLRDGRDVTLRRSVKGGDFTLLESRFSDALQGLGEGAVLAAEHGKGAKGGTSLSEALLETFGFRPSKVVTNKSGTLTAFSLRHLVSYVLVPEATIWSQKSPVVTGDKLFTTRELNVFRLLLTGKDDSSVVVTKNTATQRASKSGKMELLDQMIEGLKGALEDRPGEDGAIAALDAADETIANLGSIVEERQVRLDAAIQARRDLMSERDRAKAELDGVRAMLFRFEELDAIFASDLRRLEGIEEGGFLFEREAGLPCPLCGANAEHQHAAPTADPGTHQRAAAAEMLKIHRERTELAKTRSLLEARSEGLSRAVDDAAKGIKKAETEADAERPGEASVRQDFERALEARATAQKVVDLYAELRLRETQWAEVKALKVVKRTDLVHGIDGPTGHLFAQVCETVLRQWGFPNVKTVSYDTTAQDIAVNGRPRANNGKGVRAILHSAFKVALAIYCSERKLPHPGFLVLDSPLQAYRKPINSDDVLADDEKELQKTDLNARFYAHLSTLSDICQTFVVENTDPPAGIEAWATVQRFAGEGGRGGREGFIP